jgi:hypothetical protein
MWGVVGLDSLPPLKNGILVGLRGDVLSSARESWSDSVSYGCTPLTAAEEKE